MPQFAVSALRYLEVRDPTVVTELDSTVIDPDVLTLRERCGLGSVRRSTERSMTPPGGPSRFAHGYAATNEAPS